MLLDNRNFPIYPVSPERTKDELTNPPPLSPYTTSALIQSSSSMVSFKASGSVSLESVFDFPATAFDKSITVNSDMWTLAVPYGIR